MATVTVQDFSVTGGNRARARGVLVFGGGRETINPTDVRLRTIDYVALVPMNRSAGFPIGSISLKGASGVTGNFYGVLQGRGGANNPGSAATLIWRVGSGPGDTGLGSVGVGSKTAFFDIMGEI